MKRIVNFSGGLCSYFAARRVVELHGREDVTLLFADTMIESPGLYRFIEQAAASLELPITRIADGRTPWQLFKDRRFLSNARVDHCSQYLKRDLLNRWIKERFTVDGVISYVGISWDEHHRLDRLRGHLAPWQVEAPMCDPPYLSKCDMMKQASALGLTLSEAYTDGFPHDNCGGGCVKAGQAHFAALYKIRPAVYAEWERNEEDVRKHIGMDVSILKDRRGGTTKPMTLAAFRERIETGDYDHEEWGGCGCGV